MKHSAFCRYENEDEIVSVCKSNISFLPSKSSASNTYHPNQLLVTVDYWFIRWYEVRRDGAVLERIGDEIISSKDPSSSSGGKGGKAGTKKQPPGYDTESPPSIIFSATESSTFIPEVDFPHQSHQNLFPKKVNWERMVGPGDNISVCIDLRTPCPTELPGVYQEGTTWWKLINVDCRSQRLRGVGRYDCFKDVKIVLCQNGQIQPTQER
eukprot:scaffold74877_cov38-Cyclotella_meneghiniana.AAC.5